MCADKKIKDKVLEFSKYLSLGSGEKTIKWVEKNQPLGGRGVL